MNRKANIKKEAEGTRYMLSMLLLNNLRIFFLNNFLKVDNFNVSLSLVRAQNELYVHKRHYM